MRSPGSWAVAVRSADGAIDVTAAPFVSAARRHRALRAPFVRGVVALAESMRLGFRALAISAGAQLSGEDGGQAFDDRAWGMTAALVVGLGIGLFFVLPAGIALALGLGSTWLFLGVETGLRLATFVGYAAWINRAPGLQRTLAYHGAEHKAIACYEAGEELSPERAGRHSRLHPRCGTNFLLVLMVVAAAVYAPIGTPDWPWLLLSRVLGVPVAVAISYEAIRWMGRHRDSPAVGALSRPGLALQRLTTREPDRDQLEVAIAALEPVLAAADEAGDGRDRTAAGEAEMVA